ncbi:MAG TPA: phospho-N-acetylmuramoyl-pentapeptide-transferase [Bacteroidales bacterium]|nr:phospho-N-acetylmuramoyl-pentapeptide-transferase [Bacteroidales bacterium]HOG67273.1 phospho-N-acetylmuramoyl-pentapeptide-transferase [Bacteroidales bacterium]HPA13408.1 phospho-N-acetylmuramoyl-pentapeptide-transferase [Bacteroidales bacterium]HQF01967.1 phospho-N-acetylmuramoyl-pentapeptide-transferase [Bacteroidales bacterium]HQH15079.1 phospho-N-acetylmuramoyl-pentapeptide-transferase [Bacteroidales bacterium]
MLYYLFGYLDKVFDFPGARMFQYISFRAGMAVIVSLIISMILGKSLINLLKKMQVKESIRDLGLEGQKEKEGTPTMGGLIILGAILIPTLLFADLTNIYIIIILITTIWLGFIGFIDDYIMVFKKDKKGLAAKFKILGQVTLGLFVGLMMYYHPDIVIRERTSDISFIESIEKVETDDLRDVANDLYSKKNIKSTKSTIPFFKNNELDYSIFVSWLGKDYQRWTIIVFVAVVILIITLISNSANLTDGIDGLATGVSAIIGSTLAVLAYVSGNIFFANYLNIMYLPDSGELVIFIAAFVGACIGFLWYNTFPAQVFMGDTGSLALGGIIAVFAIMLRKELLIPLLCGIFLAESASVVMQVSYFKYTKRKYGAGKRIFKMSPLHHHYQLKGYAEPKIVQRFFIVGIMLAVFTVITLKIR